MSPKPPVTPHSTGLRDNHSRGSAGDFLQESIQPGSELSFSPPISPSTPTRYAALKEPLEAADHLNLRLLEYAERFLPVA